MNKSQIENTARELQVSMWNDRGLLWPGEMKNAIQILEPERAAKVLGIDFEYFEELGRFGSQAGRFEIAGMLNRGGRKIAVAQKFGIEVSRFTGAHEIGHWLMHPNEQMHRDRPINGIDANPASAMSLSRSPVEREADYFAACFLMPAKQVKKIFETTFDIKTPFVFDDTSAFWLRRDDPDSLLRADFGTLDRALTLAAAESYKGHKFHSLAKQFRVSVPSMAIRLNELGLIQN